MLFGSNVNPVLLFFGVIVALMSVCCIYLAIYYKIKKYWQKRNRKKNPVFTIDPILPYYNCQPTKIPRHQYHINRIQRAYWHQSYRYVRPDGKVEKHGFCMTPVKGKHKIIRLDSFT